MTMRATTTVFVVAGAVLLAGCWEADRPSHDGPLYFEVGFDPNRPAPQGLDRDAPAPFTTDARGYPLVIQAMGYDHEPMDWDGSVTVRVTPGELRSSPSFAIVGGRATPTVDVALAFDELRIWVSDEGDDGTNGSFAAGVADPVFVALPTVAELQRPIGSDDASPLTHQYVPIRGFADTAPRQLLVTTVTNDGFYVTDFDDEAGSYNSLFVFTFSRPDGVVPGTALAALAGIVSEFIGFTELQFPTYDVDSTGHSVGEPFDLDPAILCDDDAMEAWEASVVRLSDLVSDFASAADCADYVDFGQWPALVEGTCGDEPARISIVNQNTVPSFGVPEGENNQPPDERQLDYLVGILRHVAPADPPWVIEVRSCLDFPPEHRPADCAGLLERPMSGPRKAPHAYYRDIDTCEGVPYHLHGG